jgi:5'-nucleotidase
MFMSLFDRSDFRGPRGRGGRLFIAGVSALALASTAVVVSNAVPATAAPGDETVQLLSFNDYHGHVEAGTPGSIDGSFGGPAAGGGEYLSAKLTELRSASTADNSYTVAAGDLIGGSPFFSGLFHDEPSVESLNEMALDFSGVGNHEFDEGVTELLRMQNGGCYDEDDDGNTAGPGDGGTAEAIDDCYFPDDPYQGADFQWLAANVTKTGGVLPDIEPDIPDYAIETLASGNKIAFIGMTLDGTDELVAQAGIAGYTFEDEVTAAVAAADAIQAEDPSVEAMVLMLHEGGIPSPFAINGCAGISGPIVTIAENVDPRIDAIISGHTHQPYTCSIDDPADNPRPVTSAFSFGRVVTEINLELDATGEVDRSTFTMENHEVLQADLTPDPAVTAVIDKWTPLAEAQGNEPVGSITETITRGGGFGVDNRGVESAAGNLVADAQLAATEAVGAQIALMNPGGVRSDLTFDQSSAMEGAGVVTFGEAFTFQPFNNTLFTLPMTGAQIVSVLEEQCQPGDGSRPVLHLGVSDGFTYTLDITTQNGVCLDVEVTDVQLDGVDIEPATTYLVTTNIFLADGGDSFDTFAEVDPTDRIPGPQDIDALIDYFEAESPIAPPSTDRVDEIGNNLPGTIQSLPPARLLETRDEPGYETVDGEFQGEGRLGSGETLELVVAGRADVPADASAAVLNIGAVLPSDEGFLTVYPCGEDLPIASNVNYFGGDVVSNSVVAKIGVDGKVCIYTLTETDLIVDVNGLVPVDGTPESVLPARLLETRDVPGFTTTDGEFEAIGPLSAGTEIELDVAGRGGIDEDAEAVILNVGAVTPIADGFLNIYPCGEDRPQASSLNYLAGDPAVSNLVLTKVGTDGKVCIFTLADTHLIADVTAFVPLGGSPDPLVPARLLETRDEPGFETIDGEFQGEGRIAADSVVELVVTDRGGVPADADTVVLNVGAVLPAADGFLTVFPCGEDTPQASNVNHIPNDVVSNFVLAKVGVDGKVCIYTLVETDLIVDVVAATSPVVPYR